MTNEKKSPEIRFDGFAEPWEQYGLTDVLSPTVGNNTLSRADLNYDSGEVKNIHYGDVLIKFGSFVDAINDEIPFITNGTVADYKANLLQDGDIIFADTAEDETAGKVSEVTNAKETNIVSGLHTIVYRPKKKFADCFMGYYLNTNAYRHQLLPLMQGAKVLSLGRSHLATTFVRYPSSLDEQTIIADFFRNLDDTIALKKQQYEQTSNIKKSMLEKMFPKKGADVPEIRFEGYSGAWELKKLGEIADLGSSKRIHVKDYVKDGIPFYRGNEISSGGIAETTEINISEEYYETIRKIYGVPKQNDILVTAVGTLGNVWKVDDRKFYYKDGNLILLSAIQADSDFLIAFFSDGGGKRIILDSAAGSSQMALTMVKLKDIEFYLPSVDEQIAIGGFFLNLTTLITAQREELEKLQNIKKACLSKMFV